MYLKNSVQISATLQQQFTVWRKILTGENIDELLSIRQHFPYQKFPLIIFSAVCMPDHFFVQGVIDSYSMRSHAIPQQNLSEKTDHLKEIR